MAYDAHANPLADLPVNWSSSDTTVLSVADDGTLIAENMGSAWLLTVSGQARDSLEVKVLPVQSAPTRSGVHQ